jgi:hypothetical protein
VKIVADWIADVQIYSHKALEHRIGLNKTRLRFQPALVKVSRVQDFFLEATNLTFTRAPLRCFHDRNVFPDGMEEGLNVTGMHSDSLVGLIDGLGITT